MTKVISISDEAYKRLSTLKSRKESFSEVIMRITEVNRKESLLSLAGKWVGGKKESDRIYTELMKKREKMKLREVNF